MTPHVQARDDDATVVGSIDLLLVEDNAGDVTLLRDAIEGGPYAVTVHVAENAIRAFSFLAKRDGFQDAPTPDVIILDLRLPVIGGLEVLRVLKKHQVWRAIPVIVLTSSALEYDRAASLKHGAVGFYTKPRTWDDCLALAGRFAACCATRFGQGR